MQDNGPGIMKKQIPNIFGKLLYGSKFHRLKMSRGQQGIGISAAGMYGMLTTGKPVEIISRTGKGKPAHHFRLQIDTKKNKPEIVSDTEIEWDADHGTRVPSSLRASTCRAASRLMNTCGRRRLPTPMCRSPILSRVARPSPMTAQPMSRLRTRRR